MEFIFEVEAQQNAYLDSISQDILKARGQFFTSSPVARFMATHAKASGQHLHILDPGAGAGILTVAVVEHLMDEIQTIHAVVYETDSGILSVLRENLTTLAERYGERFTFEIRTNDFILARPDFTGERFDLAILNPPYFKINIQNSPYSGRLADLFKGNPNIYAFFMAVAGECLKEAGIMIAITPRSFTNGLYFKGFRQWLLKSMSLEKVHIFQSRKDAFKEKAVLQENVICVFSRSSEQSPTIELSRSVGRTDLGEPEISPYPAGLILDKTTDNYFIRLPETDEDASILKQVESWPDTFNSLGYHIWTGPVVEHRTREFIDGCNLPNSVCLYRMHNIRFFDVEWTGQHKKDARFALTTGAHRHLSRNEVTVLLKRFSAKDQNRRLEAGVLIPDPSEGEFVGFENHLNCITRKHGSFNIDEAFGLAALLNSTLIDRYFRCVSGNTQVNATEIRLMRLPARETIQLIGKRIQHDFACVDETVETELLCETKSEKRKDPQRKARTSQISFEGIGFAETAI